MEQNLIRVVIEILLSASRLDKVSDVISIQFPRFFFMDFRYFLDFRTVSVNLL
jgi:hypothetical protein